MHDFDSRLATIETDLKWIKGRLEAENSLLDRMAAILDGNGKLGIVTKVTVLWYGQVWLVGALGALLGAGLMRLFGNGG